MHRAAVLGSRRRRRVDVHGNNIRSQRFSRFLGGPGRGDNIQAQLLEGVAARARRFFRPVIMYTRPRIREL